MPIEHINKTDTLNEGREKLNNAITAFNETVVEGDSSVEAAQARVDEKGVPHPTLKARIDDGMNSVNQQLAQTDAKKADRNELQTGLAAKVGKGENESVSWCMIDQNAKEQFLGEVPPAVVGPESVNKINIVDGAATFVKRSRLGELATITILSTGQIPNLDTVNNRLVFPSQFFINNGNRRYSIDSTVVNLPHNFGNFVYFDTATETIIALPQTGFEQGVEESYLLIAVINYKTDRELFSIEISCECTINNIPSF